jgi:coenzyme F420-0:L-glutamate ligase/coenzyme F420-1:gamma-L-glutamate ligase
MDSKTKPPNKATYTSELIAVPNVPIVKPGDNITKIILDSVNSAGLMLKDGDIIAIASKIISKAENRLVSLKTVIPSPRAEKIAKRSGKDPRVVQLMFREGEIVNVRSGIVEVYHRLGFLCTSAGIDRSNAGDPNAEIVSLLPLDPDASAQKIRNEIKESTGTEVGVIINDSLGIKYRVGSIGLAIGVAGIPPILTGAPDQTDLYGKKRGVNISFADEASAAASMMMGQSTEGRPIVILRGLKYKRGDGKMLDLISKDQLASDMEKLRRGEHVLG